VTPQIPEGLVARYAYAPPGHARGEPWIVALLDRRYLMAGSVVSGCGSFLLLAAVALRWGSGAVALGLVCGVVGLGARMLGGRAGFYELAEDGTLGERIGRVQPDVTGRQRVPVRDGVIGG
jgi:hypothetical protein